MKLMTFFVLSSILFSIGVLAEDRLGKVNTLPPVIYSKGVIKMWVDEELSRVNPNLEGKPLDTQDWGDYVNFHHFVSLTFEGCFVKKEEGKVCYDYNWSPQDQKTRLKNVHLPSAEVTEEGKFVYWADRCNFFQLSEEECRSSLHTVVTHENRHYQQWLKLAQAASEKVNSPAKPKNLDELRQIPGAEAVFMESWEDGNHYQCREIEVYTTQMLTGEISTPYPRVLKGISEYYTGCSGSKWSADFSEFLGLVQILYKANNIPVPDQPKVETGKVPSSSPGI